MTVDEIAPGLWRWASPHPEWSPEEDALDESYRDVGSVYCETDEALVLIDPLAPQDPAEAERFWAALDRDVDRLGLPVEILITIFFHARSAAEVRARYAAGPGATIRAYHETVERLDVADVKPFGDGADLPGGIVAYPAARGGEVVYWLPAHRAVVPGDALIGASGGVRVCPDDWFRDPAGPARSRSALRALLDLPVERVLVSHGAPVLAGGRDALAAALESPTG